MSVNKVLKPIGLLSVLGGITTLYFIDNLIISGILILIGIALFIIGNLKKKPKDNLDIASFINMFTHFRTMLDSDANVVSALTSSLEFTSGVMYEALHKLVVNINDDHSVTPFILFAKRFNHRFVLHIMINVYMLINHGLEAKRLWQFNYLFESLIKEFNDEQIALHESSYERFNVSLFLGTGIMMFTIMGTILSMFGGL
ncbi:MAG: hypothetical protein RBS24_05085 [Bacilli bacterium]|nr:hypothetical protein [Bacilli bacterium]